MLRLLHTADWHLGQRLHDQSREYEHSRFLDWLAEELEARAVDVLLVAGDIFDSANPPISAQRQFYDFVTRVRGAMPDLQMIFLGGNHDSPARLESAAPLLEMIGVHIIGAVTRRDGVLETERLLLPLKNASGVQEALCAAMPYLRPADLPTDGESWDGGLVSAVRRCYGELLEAASKRVREGQALLTTGHCYMVNGQLSELSERRIQMGNQEALPLDIFGRDVDYVALGHLHRAQALAEHVRYSGSPLPMSLAEKDYPHQVVLVDFEGGSCTRIEPVQVPRMVEILRLPESGAAAWDEVRQQLETLELDEGLPPERHPWLEVRVKLEKPQPGLWEKTVKLLKGRPVRLLKLSVERQGEGRSLADHQPGGTRLDELDPDDVLRLHYRSSHGAEVPEELMTVFRQLRQEVEEKEA